VRFGVHAPFTAAQWMAEFDLTPYALGKVRAYGATHGAAIYQVRWEGLALGVKGDEAELIRAREKLAGELLGNAEAELDSAKTLPWFQAKIAPRLEDVGPMARLVNRLVRKTTAALPSPAN
jgi:hypothetical protein